MAITLNGTTGITTPDVDSTDLTATGNFTSRGIDDNATSTAMTLDTSGKLLVGKASASFNTTGVEADATDGLYSTRNGLAPLSLNRLTSDGDIVNLYKDGSVMGSIGADDGRVYIESSGGANLAGIGFSRTAVAVEPRKNSGWSSAEVDIGSTTYKFKDAYLSGGVYLGGVGASNKLDDYEEGTWTPVDTNGNAYTQSVTATYVKIGKLVYIYMDITSNSTTLATNSNQVAGLPFITGTSSNAGTISQGYHSGNGNVTGHMYGTSIYLMNGEGTSIVLNQRLIATGVYHAN